MATDTSKTQYEQTTSDGKLVEEEIDPKILELLGIKDAFDFDYGDYKTLLREKMTEIDMKSAQAASKGGDTKKLSDSQALLIDEFKRVKRSTGKFKLKSKKVKAEKVVNKSKTTKSKPITDSSKLLPGSGGALAKRQPVEVLKPEPQQQEDNSSFFKDLLDALKGIQSVVKDLLKILEKQLGLEKKNSENQRKSTEKKEKKKKETDLEKKDDKGSSGLLEKITKPFTSIFDTIKNFLLNVLIGSIVVWLLKVIKNPMILLKPIQGLVDGIVGFFNTVIQFIDNMVVQPVRNFINMINSALKGFIDILNSALKMLPGGAQLTAPQMPNIPEPPEIQSPDITGEKKQQAPAGPPINLKFTGGQVTPMSQKDRKQMTFDDQVSKQGGTVSSDTTSYDVSGLGPDRHLTALSTGEYVLKKGAADWLGGPAYLDSLNKMFGGSTERKVASIGDIKVQAANEGGTIAFDPDAYSKSITGQSSQINVGSGAASKRYAVSYARQGSSGTFTVKQINKIVQGAGLGVVVGMKDQLTGINPDSPEGKLVVNSVALRQHFVGKTGKIAGPVKIQVDPQAPIYWAYKQAYNTHYNKWKTQGVSDAQARSYARAAAMEFAVARKGASQLPGSKEGLDASLRNVDVAGSPSDSSSAASSSTSSETQAEPSAFVKNFAVIGDPSNKSIQDNPPGSGVGMNKPEPAPTPKPETKKQDVPKLAPASSSSITPSTKPNIPSPPSTKPNIVSLPLPSKSSPQLPNGVSNNGSKVQSLFSSYRGEEPSLAVVASIYNMWGGL